MSLEKYDWLKDIYNQINFNNLPHGIIINGPPGVGKKILAKKISKKILCNFEDKLDAQQQSLFDTDHHPDYFHLKKDKVLIHHISYRDNKWDDELGKRNVLDFLTLTPSISKNKVAKLNVKFSASFGRELEYYSGMVFKIDIKDRLKGFNIINGGRYDRLISNLGSNKNVSAVGAAINLNVK